MVNCAIYEKNADNISFFILDCVQYSFKSVLINPQTIWLDFANGSITTPYGQICVDWHKTRSGLSLKINIPENILATFIIPKGYESSMLYLNNALLGKCLNQVDLPCNKNINIELKMVDSQIRVLKTTQTEKTSG